MHVGSKGIELAAYLSRALGSPGEHAVVIEPPNPRSHHFRVEVECSEYVEEHVVRVTDTAENETVGLMLYDWREFSHIEMVTYAVEQVMEAIEDTQHHLTHSAWNPDQLIRGGLDR